MSRNTFLENNLGSILASLVVAFITGTIMMIYNADKNTEVFKTRLTFIQKSVDETKDRIQGIEEEMKTRTADRWRRIDHLQFSKQLESRLSDMQRRLEALEIKCNDKS